MRDENSPSRLFLTATFALMLTIICDVSCRAPATDEKGVAQIPGAVEAPGDATNKIAASSDVLAAASSSPPSRAPFVVANTRAAIELQRSLDRLLDESNQTSARWGVFVASLRDNRILYARNADRLFTPASNMKLYSTAAALELLGADWRWRTSVYAAEPPDARGAIDGDLTLYGRGAPDFGAGDKDGEQQEEGQIAELAANLYRRGVRRIGGNIVGDESYFSGNALGDGWLWNDVQWYFGAEVSALSVNRNEATLRITPASDVGAPAMLRIEKSGGDKDETGDSYFKFINDTVTAERDERMSIGVSRGLSDNEVRVWGKFPVKGSEYSVRLSVHQPALWAATLLRRALEARGIVIVGGARTRDARSSSSTTTTRDAAPARASELAFVISRPLGEIIRTTNKESLNLNAELLLRTLGKERAPAAVKTEEGKKTARPEPDEAEKGIGVLRSWLRDTSGVVAADKLALHDGSGLSRLDLVTPQATAQVLAHMSRANQSTATLFRDSLPVLGRDGTLRTRLRGTKAAGRVAAKTGTLTYVNALSGYATLADGEQVVFSVMCNDETASAPNTAAVIDRLLELLVNFSDNIR